MPSAQEIKHVDEFLKLMQALERDDRYENVLHELQREGKKEGVKMSEVLDKIENRGIAIAEKRGISIGERRGREKMANAINTLNSILLEQNRIEDLKRAVADWEYQQLLLAEYGLDDGEEQSAQE